MLVITDLAFSVLNLAFHLLYETRTIHASFANCKVLMLARTFLEFNSCALEVHIAVGFAAVCCRNARAGLLLHRTALLSLIFAAALVCVLNSEFDSHIQSDSVGCIDIRGKWRWGTVVLCFFLVTVAAYTFSIVKTSWMPPIIRRRSLLRALTYILNMWLTFALKAFWQIWTFRSPETQMTKVFDPLTNDAIALNGAANVATYMFWIVWEDILRRRVAQGDRFSAEALVIEKYFDLSAIDDQISLGARASAGISIGELWRLRASENLNNTG